MFRQVIRNLNPINIILNLNRIILVKTVKLNHIIHLNQIVAIQLQNLQVVIVVILRQKVQAAIVATLHQKVQAVRTAQVRQNQAVAVAVVEAVVHLLQSQVQVAQVKESSFIN